MEQRLSLEVAGKLLGITANAMRARAKKNPEKYRLEADNTGKLWVSIDAEKHPAKPSKLKASKPEIEGSNIEALKLSIDALKERVETTIEVATLEERIRGLEALLAAAERRITELANDRDQWREQAQRLVLAAPAPRAVGLWSRLFGPEA